MTETSGAAGAFSARGDDRAAEASPEDGFIAAPDAVRRNAPPRIAEAGPSGDAVAAAQTLQGGSPPPPADVQRAGLAAKARRAVGAVAAAGAGAVAALRRRIIASADALSLPEALAIQASAAFVAALWAEQSLAAALLLLAAAAAVFAGYAVTALTDRAAAPMRAPLDAARLGWRRLGRGLWPRMKLGGELALSAPPALALAGPTLLLLPIVNRFIPPAARGDAVARNAYAPTLALTGAALLLAACLALWGTETRIAGLQSTLVWCWHLTPFLLFAGVVLRRSAAARLAVQSRWPSWVVAPLSAVFFLSAAVVFNIDLERRLTGDIEPFWTEAAERARDLVDGPSWFALAGELGRSIVWLGRRLHEIDPSIWTGLHLWSLLTLYLAGVGAFFWTVFFGRRSDLANLELAQGLITVGAVQDAETVLDAISAKTPQRHTVRAAARLKHGDLNGYWTELDAFSRRFYVERGDANRMLYAALSADMLSETTTRAFGSEAGAAYRAAYLDQITDPALLFLAATCGPLAAAPRADRTPMERHRDNLAALLTIPSADPLRLSEAPLIGGALRGACGAPDEILAWARARSGALSPPHELAATTLALLYTVGALSAEAAETAEPEGPAAEAALLCESRMRALTARALEPGGAPLDPAAAAFSAKTMRVIAAVSPGAAEAIGPDWSAAETAFDAAALNAAREWGLLA